MQQLASRAGLSRPFIGQIEGGTANPSLASLEAIAAALDVPVGALFDDQVAASADLVESLRSLQSMVMRSTTPDTPTHGSGVHGTALGGEQHETVAVPMPLPSRSPVAVPRAGRVEVLRENRRRTFSNPEWRGRGILLVPDLQRLIQVLIEEHEPGGSLPDPGQHEGETFMLVLEGTFEVVVGGERHLVGAGDTIYFPAIIPHAHRLVGDVPGRALWVTSPPHF